MALPQLSTSDIGFAFSHMEVEEQESQTRRVEGLQEFLDKSHNLSNTQPPSSEELLKPSAHTIYAHPGISQDNSVFLEAQTQNYSNSANGVPHSQHFHSHNCHSDGSFIQTSSLLQSQTFESLLTDNQQHLQDLTPQAQNFQPFQQPPFDSNEYSEMIGLVQPLDEEPSTQAHLSIPFGDQSLADSSMMAQGETIPGEPQQKRGRGRPRKYPVGYVPPKKEKPLFEKPKIISSSSNNDQNSDDPNQNSHQFSEGSLRHNLRVRSSVKTYDEEAIESLLLSQRKPSKPHSHKPRRVQEPGEEDPLLKPEGENIDENSLLTEEERQKKWAEAEQRRKYKEELKKKSQERCSDDEDSDDSMQDEKDFTPNSAFLKTFRQNLIGRSSNSKIFELKDSFTDQKIGEVVKLIPHKMSNLHQTECCELRNEYKFLKKMSHPQIITLGSNKEFIRDRNFCGIILPQAQSNLMHYAKSLRHGKINLCIVRTALKQLAEAIKYLHDNFISHNDIKPDNMFMFSETDFKLADFGFSIDIPKPNAFKRNSHFSQVLRKQIKIEELKKDWKMRNKQYVAPELIKLLGGKRPRTPSDEKSCDVFALGVSFFIIIFYQLPFCGAALPTDQRYKHFFKGQVEKFWQQFTSIFLKFDLQPDSFTTELKDLFNKMLDPSPEARLSIEQVLEHPWLQH